MRTTNARNEFLAFIAEIEATVLWAKFASETGGETILFPATAGSKEGWDLFLSLLDYKYSSGYGGEVTSGAIMFSDGSWAEREEYDGASNWVIRIKPTF